VSKPPHQQALDILVGRCGEWSRVRLKNGKAHMVYDVAWTFGADDVASLKTNVSPGPDGPCTVDSFRTDDILKIEDARSGEVLFDAAAPAA
jgi:hypothetical protein